MDNIINTNDMTRVQEKMLERVAKALEEANRIKILELSGEITSHLTVEGIKKELL